jgi:MoaA/NifB/PqqE/SkfB family radical SAM enzyme
MSPLPSRYPRWLVLQLTDKCNLRCKMCYEWGAQGAYHGKEKLHTLNLDAVKKVIQDCSPGKPHYDFFGGEPLLYESIGEVISMIKYYGSDVAIPTNGTLLQKNAGMLVETGPDSIWASLDGPEEINDSQRGKGVFKQTVAGLHRIHELRQSKGKSYPKIGTIFIITPANYRFIEEFFLHSIDLSILDHISIEIQLYASEKQCREYADVLFREFGIEAVPHAEGMICNTEEFKKIDTKELVRQIKVVSQYCKEKNVHVVTYPKTVAEGNFSNYYSGNFGGMVDHKKKCVLPWAHLEITAGGDVSPCHIFYDLTVGNINEQGILDIWNNNLFSKFREYMKGHQLLPMCTSCSRYYDC